MWNCRLPSGSGGGAGSKGRGPPPVSGLREAAEVTDREIDAAADPVCADLAIEADPRATRGARSPAGRRSSRRPRWHGRP
ncbi:hypothetical protein MMR14E_19060 [Methylobacterium mesophilicum]